MKTKVLLLAALTTVGALVHAETVPNSRLAVVPVKGSEIFKVIYKSETTSKVKLSLYDAQDNVIFSESIKSPGFIRPLNFNGLNAGIYKVEITEGGNKSVETIDYVPAKSALVSARAIHIRKLKQDNKFLLCIGGNVNGEFTVRITGENQRVLHTQVLNLSGDYAQVYAVKNFKVSNITVTDAYGKVTTLNL